MKTTIRFLAATLVMMNIAVAQVPQDSASIVTAVSDIYPSWSPDSKSIVFQSDRDAPSAGRYHLYVMNRDGSHIRRLTNRATSDETPVWSPDGSTILYSSYLDEVNNELFTVRTDGSHITRLTHHPWRDGHQNYSPDGKSIIFNSQRDDDGKNEERNYEIYEMGINGSNITRLTDFPEWDTYPSISPDGRKILWRRVLPTGGNSSSGRNSEIFVMNRDGSNPINVSNHTGFDGYPEWSPDGKWIVFASNRTPDGSRGNFHLYIMRPDGSDVRRLLENDGIVDDARPAWSPDGTMIAFNREFATGISASRIMILSLPADLIAAPSGK